MKSKLAIAGAALVSMALVWGVSNAASPDKGAAVRPDSHAGHYHAAPTAPAAPAAAGALPASVDNFMLADTDSTATSSTVWATPRRW